MPYGVHVLHLLKKKLYGPFLWMGFNCLKARATSRRQFTFYHKFPEAPGTHFIDLGIIGNPAPIGLIKTESGFIVKSVETGLGR